MKPKSLSKKLTLKKKTIANLKNVEMKAVNGGLPKTTTAASFATNCCGCGTRDTC